MALRTVSLSSSCCNLTSRSIRPAVRLSLSARFSTCSPLERDADTSSGQPLRFSVGVGYATKYSPPFSDPEEADKMAEKGFGANTKIGRWKREMLARGGGRQEIFDTKQETKEDDWTRVNNGIEKRRHWGSGEDSFFVNDSGNYKTFIAVADGVGGWAESGTDPSLFAESLAYHMGQSTVRMPGRSPVDVINVGYEGVLNDDMVKCGSATACVVSMDSSARVLEAANLGDSGFCIIRDDKVLFASDSQTHYFNCPYQLAKLLPGQDDSGNTTAQQSDQYKQSLKPGDMVITYTDGLCDNVSLTQMAQLLQAVDRTIASPENAFLMPAEKELERARLFADVLVAYGRMVMARQDIVTPFQEEAAKNRLRYRGGKVDDITVLTAHVGEETDANP